MNPEPLITLLNDSLANQIAAGEVVTRPASVVKELVENALDAGATTITVDVVEGGTQLIRVVDDGHGMNASNAELCVQRHATSKLQSADDLMAISTLGFRGEALPSIASVSRFSLTSRPVEQEGATHVQIEGGAPPLVRDAAGAIGTRIEVTDLFFNVPARRKFLKTVASEFNHIKKLMLALALGFPYVRLLLTHNGKTSLQFTPARNLSERAYQVFGKKIASRMHPVQAHAPIQLTGLVSEASTNRASRAGIYAYVNGRFVRDRVISHALLSAYGDQLPKGRFPEAVLYVHLPPGEVDVNTHPTKEEIRFSHPGAIHQTIASAVASTLRSEPWLLLPRTRREERPRDMPRQETPHGVFHTPEVRLDESRTMDGWTEPPKPTTSTHWRLVGTTRRGHAVIDQGEELQLVSLEKAAKCVAYDRWLRALEENQTIGRALLFPEHVELDLKRSKALEQYADQLSELGFEITSFGGLTWQCLEMPAPLAEQAPSAMVKALAQALSTIRGDIGSHREILVTRVVDAMISPVCEEASIQPLVDRLERVSADRRHQWSLGPVLSLTRQTEA